ncbi:unnamed protein product [Sphagnum compactum]
MAAAGLVVIPAEPVTSFHGGRMPAVVEDIQIYLATLGSNNNSVIPMRVLSSDTIASVKMRIQAYKGFYKNQQRLVYRGRELTRDDCFVKDYGVCNGEVLHLVLRLSHHVLDPACGILRYEVPEILADLLTQARAGLQSGHSPILSPEGSGGAYFLKCEYGLKNVAIFKPVDEEPLAVNNPRGFCNSTRGEGLKKGTRIGEGAFREVAAYILDHPAEGRRRSYSERNLQGFAGVPPTMMVHCSHKAFHYPLEESWNFPRKPKLGSLQQFVPAFSNCEDMGPANFPVQEVHKIAILDMRLANTDRNGSNILACQDTNNSIVLVPIDHGYCLPEKFEDCTFEWLYWPQAHVPFNASTLEYIASLDVEQDIALLREYGWSLRFACAHVFRISTMLLKKGAAAGLTPFAVGSMMCRKTFDKRSPIELMLEEAEEKMLPGSNEQFFMTALAEVMDSHIKKAK